MSLESFHPNQTFDQLSTAASFNFLEAYSSGNHRYVDTVNQFLDFTYPNMSASELDDIDSQSTHVMSVLGQYESLAHLDTEKLVREVCDRDNLLSVAGLHRGIHGAITTPVVGLLHRVAVEFGNGSALDLVRGSDHPIIRRLSEPLIADGFVQNYNGVLDVQKHSQGERILKAASGAHLQLSYLGLYLHMTDIAKEKMAYGFKQTGDLPFVYRWQPDNAIASGGLLKPRVVPVLTERILEYIQAQGLHNAVVFDWGCGDLLLLANLAKAANDAGIALTIVGVDIDKNTQIPALARLREMGMNGHLIEADMTNASQVRDIVRQFTGTHIHMTNYIPHDIRGADPKSVDRFVRALWEEDAGSALLISESYRLTKKQYQTYAPALRWFWLMHELSGQNLYTRSELRSFMETMGKVMEDEPVHSTLGEGEKPIVANSTTQTILRP